MTVDPRLSVERFVIRHGQAPARSEAAVACMREVEEKIAKRLERNARRRARRHARARHATGDRRRFGKAERTHTDVGI